MEWIATLQGQTVGLDTAPLIYFIEEHPLYLKTVLPFFEAMQRGELRAVTSMVTLLEVLVHPLRRQDSALAERYREILLGAEGLTTLQLSQEIAETAAGLRAKYSIRTPDAIQVATAMCAGATYFLANDTRLLRITELKMLALDHVK